MATTTRKKKSDPHTTPAMRQFKAFKAQHPDCVLFFRMGDFYETFYDDAVLCNKVLGITLTERTAGVPMAGVPYHAIENYLRRMVEAGYRIAIADQIQDPKEAKGIVDRAVTRVITPGTLIDEALLDDGQANLVAAITFDESGDESSASVAVAELSTGLFEVFEVPGADLPGEMARLNPNELLFVETVAGEAPKRVTQLINGLSCALTPRPVWHFRPVESLEALTNHFGVSSMRGFGFDDDELVLRPAGALLRYFTETQRSGNNGIIFSKNVTAEKGSDPANTALNHLRPPVRRVTDEFVLLDQTSLQSLEIERTMRSGRVAGSLLGIFNHCLTPMGKRLLRSWLCYPLRDLKTITKRQRSVGIIMDDRSFADLLEEQLRQIQDVARMAGRITMGRATPRDLVGLGNSLQPIKALLDLLDQRPAFVDEYDIINRVHADLTPLAERIKAECVDAPPAHMRDGGLIRDGVDQPLDEARGLQNDANAWLAEYQETIIKECGISSLKVGYNRVFGYYIECSTANSSRVPDTFTRKQTLKNAERYITPELKEFETKVLNAEQNAINREQYLFSQLCHAASGVVPALMDFASVTASLDVLSCFAHRALQRGYTRPTIVEEPTLDIRGGRHPVLDELLRDQFVANDCRLHVSRCAGISDDDQLDSNAESLSDTQSDEKTLALITGPNMAGKSTYIRQIALLTLLAHTGSYIPAERATIGLVDRIFTRIGASDELHAGRSTFMVEMTETANILHHATKHSLVILDEIGRGTSTLDGLSLAWAIAEYLAGVGARTLFATHYHELTSLADRLDEVCNLHVAVREWKEEIVFLYRILAGRTDRSYGIHVAKIAGLPKEVTERADELLETLEVQTERTTFAEVPDAPQGGSRIGAASGQLSLFTEYLTHPVVDDLLRVDIEALSPLEAFDLLRRLRKKAEES